ncbi:thiamine-phosphate pyrophosphorylase [Arthrobacter crystallopoietes BAB-32]|uniref:Thiamine-phosphate synthase n=1 Tax=Arthrobacter crystallopoietes BAB-32 TaxID=1246476 RepID=N1UVK1_9MICC|nr:thiamine phosphate synthase [Arthrobacter crystallopoietes]EMY33095.1 thiamine-phosphate pyrophosphorylase [Arthrobacter crystallopoietes BAB-32]
MDLSSARLYLCTDARKEQGDFEQFLDAAYAGGVDIIQLRDKSLEAAEELELLGTLARVAARHTGLWSVNDRADLAAVAGAPVFHAGQRDLPPAAARSLLGGGTAIGRSTHTPEQVAAALGAPDVDYFCTGPVWATPTKPGRSAVGLELVAEAAAQAAATGSAKPWFAIGGIGLDNIEEVTGAGARRVVVVRAITEADDPAAAAAKLKAALPPL